MRDFINSVLLMEANVEEEMLAPLKNYYERMAQESGSEAIPYQRRINQIIEIEQEVKFAKRRDVKVWIARTARYALALDIMSDRNDIEPPELQRIVNKIVGDYQKTHDSNERHTFKGTMDAIQEILGHFLTLNYYKISTYRFTDQTLWSALRDLKVYEDEYKEYVRGYVEQKAGDEIIMTFPDGMVWMMLSRGYCDAEAKAMGHCGNAGAASGDRIISLRKPKSEHGHTIYEPCLTFILNGDGHLGEMKGRGNDKPAARYHDYIVALLRSDVIKGIRGGGYKPENNFDLNDLPVELQHDLADNKPALEGSTVQGNQGDELKIQITENTAWYVVDDEAIRGIDKEFEALKCREPYGFSIDNCSLLSLRSYRTRKNGTEAITPLILAVVKNGIVTCVMGQNNSKPSETYHPAIIKFLELPFIAGIISNQGYNPFSINDLNEVERESLIDRKPILGGVADAFKRSGLTPEIQAKIIGTLEDMDGNLPETMHLDWISSNPHPEQSELFSVKDQLQFYKWDNVTEFAQRYAKNNSEAYFKDEDYEDHIDTHVDDSDVKNFFDDLPISVRLLMLNKAKENYYSDNDIEPDSDEDEVEDISEASLLEDYLSEEWSAMQSACHTGQEAGISDEIYKAKQDALEKASPEKGHIDYTMHSYTRNGETKNSIDWSQPVRLIVSAKEIVQALSEVEDEEYLPEEFLVGDMEIEVSEPHYGFHDFDDDAALERFWEESSLDEDELPKRPQFDISKISREDKIAKIKQAMDVIPDGMIYKRFDLDTMDDRSLDEKLNYFMDQYYGKDKNA